MWSGVRGSTSEVSGAGVVRAARCQCRVVLHSPYAQPLEPTSNCEMFMRVLCLLIAMAQMATTRYIMYLTGCVRSMTITFVPLSWCNSQHNVVPDKSLVSDITHVALAFMSPATFNQVEPSSWPLFTTVEIARSKFTDGTAIMVAIGGWGNTAGFDIAAATDTTRKLFAHNVKVMIDATGADGRLKALSLEMVY